MNYEDKDFFITKDVSARCNISLKDRVHILLMRKGISQNELADQIEINKGTLSKILNGHWAPTSYVKIKMAQILDCDTLVIFGSQPYWDEFAKHYKKMEACEDE